MSEQRASRHGGSRVAYLKHEVDNWIRARVRADSGEPLAPPLPIPESPRLISVREAEDRVGFTRVHLWRLERDGKFPKLVRLRERDPYAIGRQEDESEKR